MSSPAPPEYQLGTRPTRPTGREHPAVVEQTGADTLMYVVKATLLLGVAASLAFVVLDVDGQVFAVAARLRHLVLTGLYAVMAVAIVRANPGRVVDAAGRRTRWPLGRTAVALPALSFVLVAVAAPDTVILSEVFQGAALVYGCFLAGWIGAMARDLSREQERELLIGLVAVGAIACVLDIVIAPLTALVAPAAGTAIILGRDPRRRRPLLTAVGALMLAIESYRLITAPPWQPPSSAVVGQLATTVAFIVLIAVPTRVRWPIVLVGSTLACVVGWRLGAVDLLLGHSTTSDITLMQRSYEANAVWDSVRRRATTLLFGFGPGGTVDLRDAPDASTLVSSGRDLARVESVHLLPSYLILKFGLIGLGTFAVIAVHAVRVLRRHLLAGSRARWCMILFVVCGTVNALPAATFMFSNPLPALFVGFLSVAGGPSAARRASPAHPSLQPSRSGA